MSSLDTCATSDVEVDVGAEGNEENYYCEELQQPGEEVTLDVSKFENMPPPQGGHAGDWSASD